MSIELRFWSIRPNPLGRLERGKDALQEFVIRLDVLDDVRLIIKDEGVENVEGRILERAGEDDVFEILKSVGLMDFIPNRRILDLDRFAKSARARDEVSMTSFDLGEFRVV